jgi:undecaprenyl-diphosphatase
VLAVLWRRPTLLVQVLAADLAADGVGYLLREAIGRKRPPEIYPRPKPLVHEPHSGSFPSGHAATAFACATVLTLALPRYAVPLFLLAVAIAFSRVYVGVHYPLDVVGGAFLGTLIGALLVFLGRRRRRGAGRAKGGFGAVRRRRPGTRGL